MEHEIRRNHQTKPGFNRVLSMVRQEGFEPPTFSFEGCCSIQLSYWRMTLVACGIYGFRPDSSINESSPGQGC